jgi:predicted nucleic acid-binding protein
VTLVVDASVVVAALTDGGRVGQWAERALVSAPLAAPHIMPAEVANILRRAALAGDITSDTASIAHQSLLELRVQLFPYEPLGARVWELRQTITAYDAWYVALAEALQAPLATLDVKLSKAPGPRCAFQTASDPR